jgi:hypothetical protein
MTLLSTGVTYTLIRNMLYALPARACMVTSNGGVKVSDDGESFVDLTLTDGSGTTGAKFIRVLEDGTRVTLKDYIQF